MKLLFDQNLSPWLCHNLADRFPDSVHVREVGLRDADDAVIWDYAAKHGYAIVTKDADFDSGVSCLAIRPRSCGYGSAIVQRKPSKRSFEAVLL